MLPSAYTIILASSGGTFFCCRRIMPFRSHRLHQAFHSASCSSLAFQQHFRPMKKNSSAKNSTSLRPFSSILVDGPDRAPARAMLYPVGFKPQDFSKSIIGIASTWGMVTPCNMHIDQLAREAEAGANDAGGKAIIFNTITVSDGISMGTEGMKYSLVSREVIAD